MNPFCDPMKWPTIASQKSPNTQLLVLNITDQLIVSFAPSVHNAPMPEMAESSNESSLPDLALQAGFSRLLIATISEYRRIQTTTVNVNKSLNPPERRSVGRASIQNFQKTMGFHFCPNERKGSNTWWDSNSILNLQSQENCACQTTGWSILGFSVFLKRLKDALLLIFDNILLTRLRSVSTSADSLDGTPHSTFIFNIPSAATV